MSLFIPDIGLLSFFSSFFIILAKIFLIFSQNQFLALLIFL